MQSCKLPAWEFANQRTVLSVLKNNAVKKVWEPWNSVGILKGYDLDGIDWNETGLGFDEKSWDYMRN
jgi:hypothetical protein